MSLDGLSPLLVWGLIPRFVGVLYIIAFAGLFPDMKGLCGPGNQIPLAAWLARVRRDFPGLRRFADFPTLLWFANGQGALRCFASLGILCGLCAVYGGPLGTVGLVLGWILWLSLEPMQLIFPWDTMLQEVGFLVLFLPASSALPDVHASELPLPSVAFMFRWFVLRLMLGFGKDKFIGVTKSDSLYLRGFFVWMPLPSPLGWLGHHAPAWFLKLSHVFMFFAEIIAPWLGLFAGPLRLVCYASLVALMLGIHATGNWGFFNIGYILLCTSLLDVHGSLFDLAREPWVNMLGEPSVLAVHGVLAGMFCLSLLYLVGTDSWFTRTWAHWPLSMFSLDAKWLRRLVPVDRLLAPVRLLAPFRVVNGYGVFPPNSTPPLRIIPVFEGSQDGVEWKAYGYRHLPTFPRSRPPFIAPYHARFDQFAYYVGNAIHGGSFFGSLMPYGNPYFVYTWSSPLDLVPQQLMAGDARARRLFGHDPFPDAPPKLMRVGVAALTPTRVGELRATGHWWHVRRLGTLVPPRGPERWPEQLLLPEPELFHPDFVRVKRRARPLREIASAFEAGVEPDRAILAASDLTAQEVDTFWRELVPMLAVDRGDFDRLRARARLLRERYTILELYRFERILERLAWLLRLRSEPHHLGQAEPVIARRSNFRYHLLLHELVIDGRNDYLAALAAPVRVVERAERCTLASELWTLGLLRHDQLMAHAASFRWSEIGLRSHEWSMPGLFEYYPLLAKIVPLDEEFHPQPVKHADGEHTIEGFYPPPPLVP